MSFLITMSQRELHRLEVIQKIRDERPSVVQAAEQLDLSRSQVHRLLQAYDRYGPGRLHRPRRYQAFGQVQAGMSMDIADEWSLDFSLPFKVGSDGERSAGARTGASKRF